MDPINLNQQESSGSGKGSLIGAIIVVIVLIIGAIYLFSGRTEAPVTPIDNNGLEGTTTESVIDETGTADLEAAAANIDINSLNADASALDAAVAQ
jgi:hypothetical protein